MLNVVTGNLHDGSSWVVSYHSTVLKWRGLQATSWRLDWFREKTSCYVQNKKGCYVQNKNGKERNRKQDKGVGIYLYAQNPNIAKIPTRAHHISINPNLASTHFPVSNPKLRNRVVRYFRRSCTKEGPYCQARPYSPGSSLHAQLYLTTGRAC